ncbi:hypothetical protein IFM89_029318 [Coptis chinensis]|uniref:F-box associated beta-propeller type 1 domain-containing protein n=1 Tax=Coptis chinensis TaxID=261450 RepID=A0A835IRF9_9MAGN|nr:hypothetical protein IFM89_029318 [Coptis chinensis]
MSSRVFVNGALHWEGNRHESKIIVSFDIVDEVFKEVPLLDYKEDEFHIIVGVLGGCLCVVCGFSSLRVDVWLMKVYGVKDSWTKMFSISHLEVIRSSVCGFFIRPLCYSKNDEIVLVMDKALVLYDTNTKGVKIIPSNPDILDWFKA